MFIISYIFNCSDDLNLSLSNQDNLTSSSYFDLVNSVILLNLSLIGFLTNSLTFIVLYWNSGLSHSSCLINKRQPAVLHAAIETLLNFWTITSSLSLLMELEATKYLHAMLFETVTFWCVNSFVCTRNYMVALIAMARLEAIYKPFRVRSKSLFSPRRSKLCTIIITLLSFLLSLFRIFYKRAEVCNDIPHIEFIAILSFIPLRQYYEVIYFIYQSLVPVLIVTLSTLAMSIFLIRRAKGRIFDQSNVSAPSHKATITITIIAGVFIVTEFPIFIFTFIGFCAPWILEPLLAMKMYMSLRNLVALDSCCNFVIYLTTSKQYRKNLQGLCSNLIGRASHRSDMGDESCRMTKMPSLRVAKTEQFV